MNIKKKTAFTSSMTVSAFFLAAASIASVQQKPVIIFSSSFLSWLGYLSAHKISEGSFVDLEIVEEKERPPKHHKYTGITTGTIILVTGMILGVIGLRQREMAITFPAAILFLSGYILAHYFGTGELL